MMMPCLTYRVEEDTVENQKTARKQASMGKVLKLFCIILDFRVKIVTEEWENTWKITRLNQPTP